LSAVAAVLLIAFVAPQAGAQVFYMYPGAPPVKQDQPAVGLTVGFGDNLFRTVGYGRFNVNKSSDIGVEIVLDNTDVVDSDVWRGGMAVDFKYAIVPKDSTLPFDLSVGGGFGYEWGGDMTNVEIPVGGLVSRPLELNGGSVLVPYGGVYILVRYTSIDVPSVDSSDWDFDVELRVGSGYHINQSSMVYATLHVGAGTKFYVGINFLL